MHLQVIDVNKWYISSTSSIHTSGYVVTKRDACKKCNDFKVSRKTECSFLCPHMYTCSCYDYNNRHVCKHIHRVHSLHFVTHTLQSKRPESEGSHYAQAEETDSCQHPGVRVNMVSPVNIVPPPPRTVFTSEYCSPSVDNVPRTIFTRGNIVFSVNSVPRTAFTSEYCSHARYSREYSAGMDHGAAHMQRKVDLGEI